MPPGGQNIPGVSGHGVPRRRGPGNAPRYFREERVPNNAYVAGPSGTLAFSEDGRPLPSTSLYPSVGLNPGGDYLLKQTNKGTDFVPALSFAGSILHVLAAIFAAVLSFTGTVTRAVSHNLPGVLSFTGAALRASGRALSGTLSFTGAVTRRTGKVMSDAALSFTGSVSKSIVGLLSGGLIFSGLRAITRHTILTAILFLNAAEWPADNLYPSPGNYPMTDPLIVQTSRLRALAGVLSSAGVLPKLLSRPLAATLSFTTAITKVLSRALGATASFAGTLGRAFVHTLSAMLLFNAAEWPGDTLYPSPSIYPRATDSLVKRIFALLTGDQSFTTTFQVGSSVIFDVLLSFTGLVVRRTARSLPATLSFAGEALLRFGRVLSGALSFVGSFAARRLMFRTLLASLFLGSYTRPSDITYPSTALYPAIDSILTKSAQIPLSATAGFVGVFQRAIISALTAILTFVGGMGRAIRRPFVGVVSFVGLEGRVIPRALGAVLSASGQLKSQFGRILTGVLTMTGAFGRRIFARLSGILSFIGIPGKLFPRSLKPASLSFTVPPWPLLQVRKVLSGGIALSGEAIHRLGFVLSGSLAFAGSLAKRARLPFGARVFFTGSVRRLTTPLIAGALAFSGRVSGGAVLVLQATLALTGAALKQTRKRLVATGVFSGQVTRTALRSLRAGLVLTGRTTKTAARALQAALTLTVFFIHAKIIELAAAVAFSGSMSRMSKKLLRAVLRSTGFLATGYTVFVNLFVVLRTSIANLVVRDKSATVDTEGVQESPEAFVVEAQELAYGTVVRGEDIGISLPGPETHSVLVAEQGWSVSEETSSPAITESETLELYETSEETLTLYGSGGITLTEADETLTLTAPVHTEAVELVSL